MTSCTLWMSWPKCAPSLRATFGTAFLAPPHLLSVPLAHSNNVWLCSRINVEIPTLSVSDFRRLKATDQVGTYTLFQETYDPEIFAHAHPSHGRAKGNYEYRLQTMDRAQIAGVDDVGLGALFGLGDYKFEVMGLLMHGQHLDRTYGAGPHTISVPRMRPAHNAPDAINPPHPVSDKDFMKLVAIIRCAVPYTGLYCTLPCSPHSPTLALSEFSTFACLLCFTNASKQA
jgi:biotin synthase-like enzyme